MTGTFGILHNRYLMRLKYVWVFVNMKIEIKKVCTDFSK